MCSFLEALPYKKWINHCNVSQKNCSNGACDENGFNMGPMFNLEEWTRQTNVSHTLFATVSLPMKSPNKRFWYSRAHEPGCATSKLSHIQYSSREVNDAPAIKYQKNDFSWGHKLSSRWSHNTAHTRGEMCNLFSAARRVSWAGNVRWILIGSPWTLQQTARHLFFGGWLPLCGHVYLTHLCRTLPL